MDPNANLEEQLKLAKRIAESDDGHSLEDGVRLAELVIALDEWLAKGGFKPARWTTEGWR